MNKIKLYSFLLFFVISCTTAKNISNLQIEDNYSTAIEKLTLNLKNLYLANFSVGKKKLAVIIFVNENGIQSRMGEFISNNIQLKIFDPKTFTLLERERIDSLLSEHEFNQTGLVSGIESKKLGQLLGADLVLVGTVALWTDPLKLVLFVTPVLGGQSIHQFDSGSGDYTKERHRWLDEYDVETIYKEINKK